MKQWANKSDPPNPAMTSLFQSGRHRRRVGDLQRWATAMRCSLLAAFCLALAGCGLDETLHRSDKPVSREVADKAISVPFPASTKDVYYAFHAGGMQELQMFVRFTVDPKDLDSAVTGILSDHDRQAQEHHAYQSLPLAAAPHSPVFPELLPMPWWNPDAITNGYYRGSTNGRPFFVWADVSQHTVYLCTHD
jgi:hypothetical protein